MALKTSRLAPWAAGLAGSLGWALHQQLLGDVQHFRCGYSGPWFGLLVTVGVLMLLALGAAVSIASQNPDAGPTRRWIVRANLLAAAMFLLPIVLQTGATFLLPPCAR